MLLVSSWLIGQYGTLRSFKTHVDQAILGVAQDVKELKTAVTSIRENLREDTQIH